MKSNRKRIVISSILAVFLLTPALIWSVRRAENAAVSAPATKETDAATMGREEYPYLLTAFEKEKRDRAGAPGSPEQPLTLRPDFGEPFSTAAAPGEYTGMTELEREKVKRLSATVAGMQRAAREQRKLERVMTVEDIPRAPGFEGLTPQERAKLDDQKGGGR